MCKNSMKHSSTNDKRVMMYNRSLCFLLVTSDPAYNYLRQLGMGMAAFRAYVNKVIRAPGISEVFTTTDTTSPNQHIGVAMGVNDFLQNARRELQQIAAMVSDGSLIEEIRYASNQGNGAFLYLLKKIAQNTFYFFL